MLTWTAVLTFWGINADVVNSRSGVTRCTMSGSSHSAAARRAQLQGGIPFTPTVVLPIHTFTPGTRSRLAPPYTISNPLQSVGEVI